MAASAISIALSAGLSSAANQRGILALKFAAQQEQAIVALVVEASQDSSARLASSSTPRLVDISV